MTLYNVYTELVPYIFQGEKCKHKHEVNGSIHVHSLCTVPDMGFQETWKKLVVRCTCTTNEYPHRLDLGFMVFASL